MVFRTETIGIYKVAKWVFKFRIEFATSFKFRMGFHKAKLVYEMSLHRVFKFCMGFCKAKLVCEFFVALAKFAQGDFWFAKFSHSEFGVAKFSHAL